MLLADIFQLGNLVSIQVVVFGSLIPFPIVLAGGDATSNVAGVHAETLERCNEGSCVPIEAYFPTVCSPLAAVPQAGIDAHPLTVGVWHSKVFIVLVDSNWGGVHIESGEEQGI